LSTHPNAILLCTLTPDNLSRKTMRDIMKHNNMQFLIQDEKDFDEEENIDQIFIGSKDYYCRIMENTYYEGFQIEAKEGDLIFFDLITYGYGDKITWEELKKQEEELEVWAQDICEKFNCTYKIYITANHW
jgi:hypothetical protein